MSTTSSSIQRTDLDDLTLREADTVAVLAHFVAGTTPDSATAERVHARAERITENIRQLHGLMDDETFRSLLDDEA